MGEMSEEKERKITHRLMALWAGKEKEWLTYKQIVGELKGMKVSERTAVRYLLALTREGKLNRDERGYKRIFYRPNEDFLKTLRQSLDWIRVNEESLSKIGKYVMDVIIKTIEESEETTKRIQTLLDEEIGGLPENEEYSENVEKAIFRILAKEVLTRDKRDAFFSLLENLIEKTIYSDLSNPYVFGRIADQEQLASILRDNIKSIVESYMHLWAYMYKHPATLLELRQHVQRAQGTMNQNQSAH